MPLKKQDVTSKIIRVFYDVYNELGCGFLETVYEHAMTIALRQVGLDVATQVPIPVMFRGYRVGEYRADLVVNRDVLVELKAVQALIPEHYAQVINYLKATRIEVALLVNFGKTPAFKRFLLDNSRKEIRANPRESVAK